MPFPNPVLAVSTIERTVTTADSELSLALPTNILGMQIRNFSAAPLRYAFVTGKVADPTATSADNFEVAANSTANLGDVQPGASTTLYYASTLKGARFALDLELGSV